ncbi:MAG: hypothetical protein OXF93_09240 [Acidobacteria bacterium]|nr:hypothetical protein [Acidobacteriota bacterium]
MEFGTSFGLTAVAAFVCVVLGFGAFVLWFFARLDRERQEDQDAKNARDAERAGEARDAAGARDAEDAE